MQCRKRTNPICCAGGSALTSVESQHQASEIHALSRKTPLSQKTTPTSASHLFAFLFARCAPGTNPSSVANIVMLALIATRFAPNGLLKLGPHGQRRETQLFQSPLLLM